MNEVVFNTEAEAETQQALDLVCHLASHNDNPKYTVGTTRWATPVQRLDGKWAYPCCIRSDYSALTVETYDAANYPVVVE